MRLRSKTELAALVALAYGPFLASSPGRVSADSKQDLYLDPGGFLSRAVDLWDPHVGAGTVPHQNLGYLFPVGPWYWVFDRLGVPDWVAQRLWLGTVSLLAVIGARWLFRQLGVGPMGALAGSLVYLLSPYQLAFTARMSVLLLPWAALPWLVGLTMRATRSRSWRDPALLALTLVAAGGINASSLVLVCIGPALWVVLEMCRGRVGARRALGGAGRIALLGIGVSVWWGVGLRLQGTYGLPVLQLTEKVPTIAVFSTPSDVLRGMGNWFFYGRDRTGFSLDQASAYAGANDLVTVLSYAVPVMALAGAFLLRWVHRGYFGLLVVVGTIVGVGSWPHGDPTPYGSLWKAFTTETSLGLAFRNSPRVVPLVVLGLAGLLAAGVDAIPPLRWRRVGLVVVASCAGLGLLPVWQQGFLTDGMERPEEVPGYWQEVARDLDAGDPGTRVLEVPGSSFAAYRWGTTVDPITPGLIDRAYLAREVLPAGTAGTANLLDALDRRMQLGTFEVSSLGPIARLLGVGTVVLRADLEQAGRFDTPDPGPLWTALQGGAGLDDDRSFGPFLGDGVEKAAPSVALFDVAQPRPVVRTAPAVGPVLLAGDGDGLVDAAAAGIIDGGALVVEAAPLDDATLRGALEAGAHLVVTDTNRRRIQTWFYTLRDSRGPTERAGRAAPDPTGYDFRLEVFPRSTDDSRTVVEQIGGSVDTTGEGGPERPEDRGAHAVDGDRTTAWRVGGADPRGQAIVIVPDDPVRTNEVRLVQATALDGARSVARVRVEADGAPPFEVDLGPASFTPAGQSVELPTTSVTRLRVVVLETSPPSPGPFGAAPVGFAEIRIGSLRIAETVRPPVDLLARVGAGSAGHGLDIVLTRLRLDLPGTDRHDDEPVLDRTLDLPTGRVFALTGAARSRPTRDRPGSRCRDDLLTLDGAPLPVRLIAQGPVLGVEGCSAVRLEAGRHRLASARGGETGIDIDRLVLSSDAKGEPAAVAPRGARAADAGSTVKVRKQDANDLDLALSTDGQPFWLVLGQSSSTGWSASVDGATVGPRQLVDGYANGWLVTPDAPGTLAAHLRWTPQRWVWLGLAVSAMATAACLWIVGRGRRPMAWEPSLVDRPRLRDGGDQVALRPVAAVAGAVAAGMLALLIAPPVIAIAAGAVLLAAWSWPRHGVFLLVAVAPTALFVSRLAHRPSLAWLPIVLLAADLTSSWVRCPRAGHRG